MFASLRARMAALRAFSDPLDMVLSLGFVPNEAQVRLFRALGTRSGVVDGELDRPRDDLPGVNAVPVGVSVLLWHVLRDPGARGTIVAPPEVASARCGPLGRAAFHFLSSMTTFPTSPLSTLARVRGRRELALGTIPGWGVRAVSLTPQLAEEVARASRHALILDEADSHRRARECAAAFERAFDPARGTLIRLW